MPSPRPTQAGDTEPRPAAGEFGMASAPAGTSRCCPAWDRRYTVALALLMAAVAVAFWRLLLASDVLFFRDITWAHFPRAAELRELVRSGSLPLWNPYEHFGEPVAANPNYLLFYPTAWLAWLLPLAYGFKLHYALHFFLLAAGSFLLARRAGASAFGCWLAGAIFVFSGPVRSLCSFYNFLPAVAWMPAALLAADSYTRQGGWRRAATFAGAMTMQFFAGEPLTSLATAVLALAWMMAFAPPGPLARRAALGRFALGGLLALGLSAAQLLPAAAHIRYTERAAGLDYQHALFWSLHPLKLLELLLPDFWSSPITTAKVPWVYMDGVEALLLSLFIGVVPVGLALAGVFGSKTRHSRFWALAGLAFLVLALGRYTPAGYFFYYFVPLYKVLRFPVKFLLPTVLAAAQLAALGADALRSLAWRVNAAAGAAGDTAEDPMLRAPALRWIRATLLGFGLLWLAASVLALSGAAPARNLAGAMANWFFGPDLAARIGVLMAVPSEAVVDRAASWLLVAVPSSLPYVVGSVILLVALLHPALRQGLRSKLVLLAAVTAVAHLAVAHSRLNMLTDPRFFTTEPPALQYLGTSGGPLRIFPEPKSEIDDAPAVSWRAYLPMVSFLPPIAHEPYSDRLSLQAAAGILGMETGFADDIEDILAAPQHFLVRLVHRYRVRSAPLVRLLRLSSVQYALYKLIPPAEGLQFVAEAPNATNVPLRIYRVENPLPRAYIVSIAEVLPLGLDTVRRLAVPDFDPTRAVVLAREDGAAPAPGAAAPETPADSANNDFAGAARVVLRTPMRVEVEAQAPHPSYLVLTDSYDPDWNVSVNGRQARLLHANQIFRAVALPAGDSRVVFEYRPLPLYLGVLITLATGAIVAFFCVKQARPSLSFRRWLRAAIKGAAT